VAAAKGHRGTLEHVSGATAASKTAHKMQNLLSLEQQGLLPGSFQSKDRGLAPRMSGYLRSRKDRAKA
jgi:hypothetical protein